jgi:hypothetical protein
MAVTQNELKIFFLKHNYERLNPNLRGIYFYHTPTLVKIVDEGLYFGDCPKVYPLKDIKILDKNTLSIPILENIFFD